VSDEITEKVLEKLRAETRERLNALGPRTVNIAVRKRIDILNGVEDMGEEYIEYGGLEYEEGMKFELEEDVEGGKKEDTGDSTTQQPAEQGAPSADELFAQGVEQRMKWEKYASAIEMEDDDKTVDCDVDSEMEEDEEDA
jgi:hypothetical protein